MITAITTAITLLGTVMLLVLYLRLRAAGSHLALKRHRSKGAGFADLLNYAAVVDDGVIVGKNGSFMAAWLYEGEDNASSTEAQREMVSFRLNQALAGMGNGWMIHVDAVRRTAASGCWHSSIPGRIRFTTAFRSFSRGSRLAAAACSAAD